jgi:hypothetical protein
MHCCAKAQNTQIAGNSPQQQYCPSQCATWRIFLRPASLKSGREVIILQP